MLRRKPDSIRPAPRTNDPTPDSQDTCRSSPQDHRQHRTGCVHQTQRSDERRPRREGGGSAPSRRGSFAAAATARSGTPAPAAGRRPAGAATPPARRGDGSFARADAQPGPLGRSSPHRSPAWRISIGRADIARTVTSAIAPGSHSRSGTGSRGRADDRPDRMAASGYRHRHRLPSSREGAQEPNDAVLPGPQRRGSLDERARMISTPRDA